MQFFDSFSILSVQSERDEEFKVRQRMRSVMGKPFLNFTEASVKEVKG